jgi:signal peptidase II
MARRALGWFLMLFTVALVGCDHATKIVAQSALERSGPLSIVPGLLDLRYAENHDTAFSLLRSLHFPGKAALLFALSALILGFVLVTWWRRRRAPAAEQIGYALVVAGAVGNALDRALRGFVVDFIEIHRWPVFNVADIAIVAGVMLLAIVHLRRPRELQALGASAQDRGARGRHIDGP